MLSREMQRCRFDFKVGTNRVRLQHFIIGPMPILISYLKTDDYTAVHMFFT